MITLKLQGDYVSACRASMDKRLHSFDEELLRVRTGRASVSMLDRVMVKYYGSPTPLNQVATLTVPDARTIVITPFEKKTLADIEKAIMAANLGLQPNNDGNIIRVPVPPLTEDRRKELVKSIKKLGEDAKVAIRLLRRDANDKIKKNKDLAEDASKKIQKDVQKETDTCIAIVDSRLAEKKKNCSVSEFSVVLQLTVDEAQCFFVSSMKKITALLVSSLSKTCHLTQFSLSLLLSILGR